MPWRTVLVVTAMVAAFAPEASACSIWVEPPLAGESDAAYRLRVEAFEREREAQRPAREAEWLLHRQASGLETATMIFIARNTPWLPPLRRSTRRGRPVPPPVLVADYMSSYYTPNAWLRGRRTRARFRVETVVDTCGGLSGVGDATLSQPGDQFIFFASGEPLNALTLIDAIAIDKVTDPALVAFVARFRR